MAKKKSVSITAAGTFVRNLGWKRSDTGYLQHKFHLGRDEAKATLASLRLEHLWAQVVKRWERENSYSLEPTNRPVWDATTLLIADAVRKGESVAHVPLPVPYSAMIPESPLIGDWLHRLQTDITVIKIEIDLPAANERAEDYLETEGHRLLDMGRKLLRKKAGGETLHVGLAAYGEWIQTKYIGADKRLTAWGGTQIRQVAFLRKHLPDGPLATIDTHRIEELIDLLRLRPNSDDGTPVSVAWTKNVIKQFRHFLRWLNRSPEFAWKRPVDLEFQPIRIPQTSTEKGQMVKAFQVETYSLDELRTLWEYASPFKRLILLLTLNTGFGKAELASLDLSEVRLRCRHPHEREVGHPGTDIDGWIMRVRHKSGVYGEWKLWPETIMAIEWWLKQRTGIEIVPGVTTLLVNGQGQRFDAPTKGNHTNYQLPNAWSLLTATIRRDHPEFRQLSLGKLRKTAGNLIRSVAGGEVAGIFLCHGLPVRADGLLDVYTNRPYGKVFDAIEQVGERLRPLWASVSDPFPATSSVTPKGGPNISPGKIRRIQTMKRQGYQIKYIAEKVGVSRETVRRWIKRSEMEPNRE